MPSPPMTDTAKKLIRIEKYKDLRVSPNIDLVVGKACSFNGMIIQNDGVCKKTARATVTIGRNFHSGKGCVIRTSDHDFSRGYPMVHGSVSGYKSADVMIGDFVWIGDDVLIMKGISIGDGAIIQARSVVVSDIPPLSIAGGHPCRVFSQRDPEEYEFFTTLGLNKVTPDQVEEKKAWFDAELQKFKASRKGQDS